jgi:hypothetical protein
MAEVLYTPNREQVVTTNVWAFLHWLRMTRRVALADWAALQAWSAREPAAFEEAVAAFAGSLLTAREDRTELGGLADRLLFADLRPDDRLLVVTSGATDLLDQAAEASASVLVAPAQVIAEAAFQRPQRPDLSALRTIIAMGGPMSPEARRRIYAWVKADVMLLARSGDTFWGNPLEPVLAQQPATPAFLSGGKRNPPPTPRALRSR